MTPPPPPPPLPPPPPPQQQQQQQAGADEQARRQLALPRIFSGELRQMMSGFGDSQNPRADSVKLMEEIVLEYIAALNAKSTEVALCNKRERADLMDVMYVIRRDTRRLNRVRYLLEMKAEIKKATALNAEEVSKGGGS